MTIRRVLVTGASGFVGRTLLDDLKDDFTIFGLARRSQARSGAPVHPNIRWFQADIGDRGPLSAAFRAIQEAGGVDAVVHLAAHYDFSGEDDPEYWRTNVQGLRNVLDCVKETGVKRFIFSSSVAACRFPPPGGTVNESTAPDGPEVYSRTKAVGEQMLAEYDDSFRSVIMRFGALFSDWCEYYPQFVLMKSWLSGNWDSRILAGRGRSALPYMHVREIPPLVRRVFARADDLGPREVVIASTDGAVTHHELYSAVMSHYPDQENKPIFMPKALCGPGIRMRELIGRLSGSRPFERPWMARYIDEALRIDASRTRARLDWAPRERLEILRRMPFLIENLKMDPQEWHRRNSQAVLRLRVRPNLRIHALLERHEREIADQLTAYMLGSEGRRKLPHYQNLREDLHQWHHELILRHLMNAVRTQERGVFFSYCDDLAARRIAQGFPSEEVCEVLEALGRVAVQTVLKDPAGKGLEEPLHDYVTMAVRFGADRVLETYDVLASKRKS